MLRAFVLLLLLLNGLYFAWGQGWLLDYGYGRTAQSEPQRLQRQIHPEAIQVISAAEAEVAKVEAAKAAAAKLPLAVPQPNALCLQSPVFDLARADAVRAALVASLPTGTWALEEAATPERWIIYMGKYENANELAKKRAQLTTLGLNPGPLSNSALTPGLSLGAFVSQAQATSALEALVPRGVRTARVLLETPAGPGWRLRLPAVDDALQQRLPAVRTALAGRALVPCAGPDEPR